MNLRQVRFEMKLINNASRRKNELNQCEKLLPLIQPSSSLTKNFIRHRREAVQFLKFRYRVRQLWAAGDDKPAFASKTKGEG